VGAGSQDSTDEVEAKVETLLPTLLDAGYVEADEHIWRFTPKGVARVEALTEDSVD